MKRQLLTLSLFTLLLGFAACNKDDDDLAGDGTLEATVDGGSYTFNPEEGIYSEVTEKLIVRAFCEGDDCAYDLQLEILGGLAPRTVSSEDVNGDFCRVLVTFLKQERKPERRADTATIIIDNHNESAQTISGNFNFTVESGPNEFIDGSGTFNDLYYD